MGLDPAVLLDYATRTVWALAIGVVALLIARGVRVTAMRRLAQNRAQANVTVLIGNLAQVIVITLGGMLILAIYTRDAFGWILTSFSVLGIVLGLSLQDILKNFFAGVWVLVERPFRIGDIIEVTGYTGVVDEISFRTTQLRTADGRQVIVPNGTFMTGSVVNLTRFPTRRASLWLIVDDGERPISDAEIRAALAETKEMAADPAPKVELRSVSEGKAHYLVSFWSGDRDVALSSAVRAIRHRFPQAEMHGGSPELRGTLDRRRSRRGSQ